MVASMTRALSTVGISGKKGSAICQTTDEPTEKDQALPSLREIRDSLPLHVWEPPVITSLKFMLLDALYVAVAGLVASYICPRYPMLWLVYWVVQGTTFWALFVLGHDCGHGSFSSSKVLNDICGQLMHSFIMVPYYQWKLSHRHHHRNTSHLHNDEVFKPADSSCSSGKMTVMPFILQYATGLSWWLYLVLGYVGSDGVSHLSMQSHKAFAAKYGVVTRYQHAQLWLSWILLPSWAFFLFSTFSLSTLVLYYFGPLFVFASWLTLVTFLHHFDEHTEYTSDSWTFVKGGLNSVDRDYGIFQYWTHNIGTHQVHHLFPAIPHFYLDDATAAFRKAFPHLVRRKAGFPLWIYPSHIQHFVKNFYFERGTKKLVWGKIL